VASTRDIRRRIKSVKNTRQITKAMELVAASKMKKAQQAALAGRPYAELMTEMLAALANRVEASKHPFLAERPVRTLTVGDRVAFNDVKVVAEFMVKQYLDGVVDTVEVIWARFRNTLVQVPTVMPLLPLTSVRDVINSLQGNHAAPAAKNLECQMLFEPDASTVLESLLPLYLNRQVYHQVLDAKASEHSARMVAMKTAKDNATKLLGDLTLEYNKARQAGITQEILEITAAQFSAA
jgi:F-type H+-transporting ATPase subunit gamma